MIIIDTETTGLDKENDEIIQLSIMNDKDEILMDQYFKPTNKTEWNEAMKINKITPDMVKDCPTFHNCKEQIQNIFSKENTIVGYNTNFDIGFIKNNNIEETATLPIPIKNFLAIFRLLTGCLYGIVSSCGSSSCVV